MDRKFLLMVAAACGALVLVSILFLPVAGEGEYSRNFISGGTLGIVLLLLGIAVSGTSILLFLGKTHLVGPDEASVVKSAFGFFALGAFLGLAQVIDGADGMKAGFWVYWIACLIGGFAMLLVTNPALAKRIAEAAKEKPDAGEKKDDEAPAEGGGA
jgi:multisubunit Na+/H+ antiporter MnhG subunit